MSAVIYTVIYKNVIPDAAVKNAYREFGPCGVGWRYEIVSQRLEDGANGEIAAFVEINPYIKHNSEWSAAIPGSGGSIFVAKERFYSLRGVSSCTRHEIPPLRAELNRKAAGLLYRLYLQA